MCVGGAALRRCADEVIDRGRRVAAYLMEAAAPDVEFADGDYRVRGTDRSVAIADVARAVYAPGGFPVELGVGLEGVGYFAAAPFNYPNGCHVAEVEIDPETGAVVLDRYSALDDVGVVINPLLLDGQLHGGIAQGVGQALSECIVLDGAGQIVTGSLMDYAIPRADDLPAFALGTENVPTAGNPLGVKGGGELGTVGACAAVMNAVLDALRPLGVTHLDMPATPSHVWHAIERAKTTITPNRTETP
jgi:carbon-monoxide dehydrogenase large subunit